MTSTTLDVPRAEITTKGWARVIAALGGLGLVAGLIMLMVSPASDDTGQTPAEVVAYASSHEGWNVAILLFGLASIALGGLRRRVSMLGCASSPPRPSRRSCSSAASRSRCASRSAGPSGWPRSSTCPSEPARALAQAEAYLGYDDVGWFLLGASGVAAALMIVPASIAAMRAGLPKWLGWLGVVAGVASLATVGVLRHVRLVGVACRRVRAVACSQAGFGVSDILRSDPRLRRGTSLRPSAPAAGTDG